MSNDTPPLILTLKLDAAGFEIFNDLRQRHFPPARNFLPAHITLFHHLPGERENEIRQTLIELAARTKVFELDCSSLRFLGKGVAINAENSELVGLRAGLQQTWFEWLGAQDRQKGYRPHVTVQNKVAPERARELYETLSKEWRPRTARGEGLLLWQYLGGPWRLSTLR